MNSLDGNPLEVARIVLYPCEKILCADGQCELWLSCGNLCAIVKSLAIDICHYERASTLKHDL